MGQLHIVGISPADKIDVESIGTKAYELGELVSLGIPIPQGFVIKTSFYEEFLKITGICLDIEKTKKTYHPSLRNSVEKLFQPIRRKIMHTHIPHNLASDLHKFYRKLAGEFKEDPVDIMSSSKTNECIIFSRIKGDANLVLKIKTIWSTHLENPAAIVIMKNIKFEIKGKMFTDYPAIDKRLSEKQMNKLIEYCKIIHNHFYFPREIEYVATGNSIFIVRINPFTGAATIPKKVSQVNKVKKVFIKGDTINPGIVTGPVKIFNKFHTSARVKSGEIIIIRSLNATLYQKIKNAKAVVIDSVFSNSLNKTLYRKDFQIPTVEGAKNATQMFQNGSVITVNGVTGEIYSGGLIY